MPRSKHGSSAPCTIVIKLGTSSIVHETTHQPLLSILSSIVETAIQLRSHGHKVVIVSSGAIGVGLKRMDIASRPKSLAGTQALAAIGQGRLIALWDNLFGQLGQPIAQVLLTRGDISDRTRYLNAVNTLTELITMGVIPIVNENDTVSVSEIKFGDNDTLSAITAAMLHADYLFLLTDVDGLYTSNPRKNPAAKPIEVVTSIPVIRAEVSTNTLGSKLGTGGMETKLIAAEIATAAGITTIICSSKTPESILGIIEYNNARRRSASSRSSSNPSTPMDQQSGRNSPIHVTSPVFSNPESTQQDTHTVDSTPTPQQTPTPSLPRPPHTVFTPSPIPLRDLKSWTSHTLSPAGSVIIDAGAHHVLSRRDSGGRLLPAGVLGVRGRFASGQAVRIVVRRRRDGTEDTEAAARGRDTYANGTPVTQPGTPNLKAAASVTSSVASLDPLSRSTSFASLSDMTVTSAVSTPGINTGEEDPFSAEKEDEAQDEEWEMFEVGRGLANYNSAQITRVKGVKSSHIAQILGYADSEYVAENITIRIPP
ncbi:glutamate 5-kinase [Rickenella mellea]|uniref:Glutamate 5-kinase n=1 Tax=Rickenella mellea TaxID=50990 RepID=A0A4Y7PXU7_9AGAM|nr:glutamate 5-kinase [Rickenella mellea]